MPGVVQQVSWERGVAHLNYWERSVVPPRSRRTRLQAIGCEQPF